MAKFYDTSTLLDLQEEAFQDEEPFYISSITLNELEDIKTSFTRDEEIKYAARHLLNLLNNNLDKFHCLVYTSDLDEDIKKHFLPFNNDSKIIIQAYNKSYTTFYTGDLACYMIAKSLDMKVEYTKDTIEDNYTGYVEISLNDEELARFYNITLSQGKNVYNLLNGQYLLIRYNGIMTDKYRWAEDHYEQVQFQKAQSKMFGKITPKDNDPYQQIALDSMENNQITMLRGPAGTGKSLLALGYLTQELEKGSIDKIIIFCNTVAVRGSAKLGYYPGSKDEKLLDSQIGNFLSAKFGSITEVERMIEDRTLILVPVADCRGMDTTGMKAGIYVTEAQNTSIDIMKLILQRIGDDCICIVEGDDLTQVDMKEYSGKDNGMRRLSEVFRGKDFYGEVKLKTVYRSKIAAIAELM